MRVHALYGPPGTGKTTELLRRVKETRDRGVQAERIAFISFTRAAASEALSRLGLKKSDNVSTIHAMAFRSLGMRQSQVVDSMKLREFSAVMGIPIIGKSPEDDEERADGDFYLDILNYARNTFSSPEEVYDISDRPGTRAEFSAFVRAYADWKSTYAYYDFTDMLERASKGPTRSDVEVVFIDEGQDLSPLQWRVVDRLCKRSDEVHVAGDDDQAIYSWAGADVHGMARFAEKHRGSSHVLSQSHRLPSAVHSRSQELIRRINFRVDKEFRPRDDVGLVRVHGSINSVEIRHGEDVLLLGRTHSILREVEQSLIEQRTPYIRQSGRPGMYQNRYASAVRSFNKLARGESLTEGEKNSIFHVGSAETRAKIENNDLASITRSPFWIALQIPSRAVDFYAEADLDSEPTIRLSTIHAAKGHEADRVVLLTDMTTRVQQSADKAPDDEIRVFYVGMTRSKRILDIVEGYNGYKL